MLRLPAAGVPLVAPALVLQRGLLTTVLTPCGCEVAGMMNAQLPAEHGLVQSPADIAAACSHHC